MMLEAMYGGDTGLAALTRWTNAYDAHYLTIDDVVLAFRPGSRRVGVIDVLASLTRAQSCCRSDGDDDDDEPVSKATGKIFEVETGRVAGEILLRKRQWRRVEA